MIEHNCGLIIKEEYEDNYKCEQCYLNELEEE